MAIRTVPRSQQPGAYLRTLQDVLLITPADGEVLTYDAMAQRWVNAIQAGLGFTAEDVANKSTDTALGTSDTLYSSQKAVKTYIDSGLAMKQNTLVLPGSSGEYLYNNGGS